MSLWPLLLSGGLLLGCNGLQSTLLAVRGGIEGFPVTVIGMFLSAYYVGLVLGCRFAPAFVRDVGHVRSFTAFASIASAATLAHAIVVEPVFWLALRVLTGFSFAAMQMVLEAWLNERSTNATRGRVLSAYRITDFSFVTAMQASLTLFDPQSFVVFSLLSVAISLALVPVALTRVEAPPPPVSTRLHLGRLWRVSPVAFAGAAMVGLAASSYWSMGPVFVRSLGYAGTAAGPFVASIILGGALAQWPVGWLSDRFDRRAVLMSCAVGAAGAAVCLPLAGTVSFHALLGAGAVFGVFAMPCFGLTVAHANDHADPGEALSVNGGLLLLYGVAAIAGASVAPQAMRLLGPAGLFWWVASVYVVLVFFCAVRMTRRTAPAATAPYVPVPRTTPTAFALDPRVPDQSPR
ncbi:MFS transporter [Parvularcula dongshanensis]|nr:MFS transporter [Parvularcula dongshanensis]